VRILLDTHALLWFIELAPAESARYTGAGCLCGGLEFSETGGKILS
jgi:hypothetical protein